MPFGVLVVVDSYEEEVARIVSHGLGVVSVHYLADGILCAFSYFYSITRVGDVTFLRGDEHEVGIALTRSILAMDMIVIAGIVASQVDGAVQRVLAVVGENVCCLTVDRAEGVCHVVDIDAKCGSEQFFRELEGLDHLK